MIRLDLDDAGEIAEFRRALRQLDNELAKGLTRELRKVIREHVVPDAKSNASWSSRIPRNIRPMVQARRLGVRVSSRGAPHARPFEGISKGARGSRGSFRHPLFGDRDNWFEQSTRPFLTPAMADNTETAAEGALKALDDASKKAGWS